MIGRDDMSGVFLFLIFSICLFHIYHVSSNGKNSDKGLTESPSQIGDVT